MPDECSVIVCDLEQTALFAQQKRSDHKLHAPSNINADNCTDDIELSIMLTIVLIIELFILKINLNSDNRVKDYRLAIILYYRYS